MFRVWAVQPSGLPYSIARKDVAFETAAWKNEMPRGHGRGVPVRKVSRTSLLSSLAVVGHLSYWKGSFLPPVLRLCRLATPKVIGCHTDHKIFFLNNHSYPIVPH